MENIIGLSSSFSEILQFLKDSKLILSDYFLQKRTYWEYEEASCQAVVNWSITFHNEPVYKMLHLHPTLHLNLSKWNQEQYFDWSLLPYIFFEWNKNCQWELEIHLIPEVTYLRFKFPWPGQMGPGLISNLRCSNALWGLRLLVLGKYSFCYFSQGMCMKIKIKLHLCMYVCTYFISCNRYLLSTSVPGSLNK